MKSGRAFSGCPGASGKSITALCVSILFLTRLVSGGEVAYDSFPYAPPPTASGVIDAEERTINLSMACWGIAMALATAALAGFFSKGISDRDARSAGTGTGPLP
ncbi:MAG: hypothetical protein OXF02_06850 [Simkaniaceae bacterium]|nr:hypothetical protein [Simkaniaceae bacterium]